jgi:hypothetical protein
MKAVFEATETASQAIFDDFPPATHQKAHSKSIVNANMPNDLKDFQNAK